MAAASCIQLVNYDHNSDLLSFGVSAFPSAHDLRPSLFVFCIFSTFSVFLYHMFALSSCCLVEADIFSVIVPLCKVGCLYFVS